jgi:hypothetical protein
MRKSILMCIFSTLSLFTFSQGFTEKSYDKFNLQTIEVLGHTFSVGDTLTFTTGSIPNGEFMCTQLSPLIFMINGKEPPHLAANFTNYRYIIEKIRNVTQGLNSQTYIVIYIAKKTPVWVDPTIAITKKEILY